MGLKGGAKMECPNCGANLGAHSKFCKDCGTKIRIIYPDKTCAKCGYTWTPRKPNPVCCPACGFRLNRVTIADEIIDDNEERECFVCEKMKKHTALFRPKGVHVIAPFRSVCYECLIIHGMERLKEDEQCNVQSAVTKS